MRTIAVEEHFATPAILDATGGSARLARMRASLAQDLTDLGERRLAAMDASGIDVQILSHSATPSISHLPPQQEVALARDANDRLAAAVGSHPDRFAGLALLPMTDPELATDELERTITQLGFVGGMIHGSTRGRFLDDRRFDGLLERFASLGVPLYVHPAAPVASVQAAYYSDLEPEVQRVLSMNGWGWHAETGLHVLRMTAAGVFDRHPDLQLVIGHMGEMLPFMLGRIDNTLLPEITGLDRPISEVLLSQVHLTTSALFTLAPLLCALMTFGADRLMFAVDWPFSANDLGRQMLEQAPLPAHDLEKISHGNAERIFRLSPPPSGNAGGTTSEPATRR